MIAKRMIGIGFVVLVAAGASADASAQARGRAACGDRQEILAQLKGSFDEQPTAFGTTGDGGVVELTTSSNGSWTLMLSLPNGRACLIATGEDWEQWPQGLTGRDS
jgi:hypothetical protein